MTYVPKACSIFLNRICPRSCNYCNVVDYKKEKKRLSIKEWKKVFVILEDCGVKFFLILGTEPLMMGDDLVELVKFWNERNYEYGFYSTSPEPFFSNLKEKLKKVKIRNWSCGLDYVDEVYKSGNWSNFTRELVEKERDSLVRKAREGIKGMLEMQDTVKETHALITVSKMNIEMVPEMVCWFVDNIKNIHIGINFVEFSMDKEMDFGKKKEDIPEYFFTKKDLPLLKALNRELLNLPMKYRNHIQSPPSYFNKYDRILNLNHLCDLESMALGIDCDSILRLCGYKELGQKFSVFDLENLKKREEIFKVVEGKHEQCSGCDWAFPAILHEYKIDGVNYQSKWWKKRLVSDEKSKM